MYTVLCVFLDKFIFFDSSSFCCRVINLLVIKNEFKISAWYYYYYYYYYISF